MRSTAVCTRSSRWPARSGGQTRATALARVRRSSSARSSGARGASRESWALAAAGYLRAAGKLAYAAMRRGTPAVTQRRWSASG
jgi:hypothetical protein